MSQKDVAGITENSFKTLSDTYSLVIQSTNSISSVSPALGVGNRWY